jgi:hypothetical protein
MAKSLPVPDAAQRDPKSVEMVRTWIAEGDLFVVLNIGFWESASNGIDEREAWGMLMADMARHIANAHETEYGRNPHETLEIVRKSFEREIVRPTSSQSGQFTKGNDSDAT